MLAFDWQTMLLVSRNCHFRMIGLFSPLLERAGPKCWTTADMLECMKEWERKRERTHYSQKVFLFTSKYFLNRNFFWKKDNYNMYSQYFLKPADFAGIQLAPYIWSEFTVVFTQLIETERARAQWWSIVCKQMLLSVPGISRYVCPLSETLVSHNQPG